MPQRLIDIPIESLPFVDEHSTTIAATQDAVWEALLEVSGALGSGPGSSRLARALRCMPIERRGEPGQIGSTVPGFVVTRAVQPAVLALMGEHRFSRYALIFTATEAPTGAVRLSAETRAEFPGRSGSAYRALVIGTRGHALVTNSILRAVRRRAERRTGSESGS
jgi:hypothetical protein